MKNISLAGLLLGVVLGSLASLLLGSWVVWLGAGLAIGVVVGSVRTGRRLMHGSQARQGISG